jgi:uncharacterized membrane-anchored protein YjiN (DUF445 family)
MTDRAVHDIPEARERTKQRARELKELVAVYIRRHLPEPSPPAPLPGEPPRLQGGYEKAIYLLMAVPWLLGILFLTSFAWDFPGVVFTIAGYDLEMQGLLRIVSVSGLIGFMTNWLAITMLFHPRKKRPIFGQGLIPAQRERVIYRLAQAVSKELINEEIIKAKIEESGVISKYRETAMHVTRGVLEDDDFRRELKGIVGSYVEEVLSAPDMRDKIVRFTIDKLEGYAGKGLGGVALKLYRFMNEEDFQRRIDEAVRELPDSIDPMLDGLDELLDKLPEQIEARSEDIEIWATRIILGFVEKLDVYRMITENMHRYDEQQLERLLKNTSNEQLNYIKYLGGILGFLGGFIIWKPLLALSGFALTLVTLLVLDVLLFKVKRDDA